jgi:hypothetical protein
MLITWLFVQNFISIYSRFLSICKAWKQFSPHPRCVFVRVPSWSRLILPGVPGMGWMGRVCHKRNTWKIWSVRNTYVSYSWVGYANSKNVMQCIIFYTTALQRRSEHTQYYTMNSPLRDSNQYSKPWITKSWLLYKLSLRHARWSSNSSPRTCGPHAPQHHSDVIRHHCIIECLHHDVH